MAAGGGQCLVVGQKQHSEIPATLVKRLDHWAYEPCVEPLDALNFALEVTLGRSIVNRTPFNT